MEKKWLSRLYPVLHWPPPIRCSRARTSDLEYIFDSTPAGNSAPVGVIGSLESARRAKPLIAQSDARVSSIAPVMRYT